MIWFTARSMSGFDGPITALIAVSDWPSDSPHQRLCKDATGVGVGVGAGVAVDEVEGIEPVVGNPDGFVALVPPQAARSTPRMPATKAVFPNDLIFRSSVG
jgi:hypothetical protein